VVVELGGVLGCEVVLRELALVGLDLLAQRLPQILLTRERRRELGAKAVEVRVRTVGS